MFKRIEWQPEFKKEWSWLETEGIMAYLQKLFKENYRIRNIDEKFGLPYTSSSDFAVISNTNCQFEIESGINLDGFAIIDNDYPYIIALGTDNEENDYFYIVE
jgi:hypothetical protein